jgi:hypothetical protein
VRALRKFGMSEIEYFAKSMAALHRVYVWSRA